MTGKTETTMASKKKVTTKKKAKKTEVPALFRINVEVGNVAKTAQD